MRRTLALWRERFLAAWPAIEKLGFDDVVPAAVGILPLPIASVGFRQGAIDVGFYVLE